MHRGELTTDPIDIVVSAQSESKRLDAYLAEQFPLYSRVKLRKIINAGGVLVDGNRTKAAYRLTGGESITITLPELPEEGPEPENIPLDILYEDESLVAINKPPAMVVHPSKGHWSGTLTAALAYHFENLSEVGGPMRPGIVHRLDRDTSGVIVVAKSDQVHLNLAAQFEARQVEKEYFALVIGAPDRDRDNIDMPIGVHPYQREKMAIRVDHTTSRAAHTFYEVSERFVGFSSLKVLPKTGRTHQIRLHLAHIGCPVLCDRQYGGRAQITYGEIQKTGEDKSIMLQRHALHARRLKVTHPITGESIQFEADLPDDLTRTLDELRTHRAV